MLSMLRTTRSSGSDRSLSPGLEASAATKLLEIQTIVTENVDLFEEKWNEHFAGQG